jgi:hypothetical protein
VQTRMRKIAVRIGLVLGLVVLAGTAVGGIVLWATMGGSAAAGSGEPAPVSNSQDVTPAATTGAGLAETTRPGPADSPGSVQVGPTNTPGTSPPRPSASASARPSPSPSPTCQRAGASPAPTLAPCDD